MGSLSSLAASGHKLEEAGRVLQKQATHFGGWHKNRRSNLSLVCLIAFQALIWLIILLLLAPSGVDCSQPKAIQLQPIDHRHRLGRTHQLQPDEPVIGASSSRQLMMEPSLASKRSGRAAAAGQQPKLVQWANEAVQYYEGSTLVLSCSLAMQSADGQPLKFAWFKQGKPLMQSKQLAGRLTVETLADYSFLRLADLRASDSGAYTCAATNSFGQEDRTTSQVIVNVKLKWLAPSGGEQRDNKSTLVGQGHQLETVPAGQTVAFECGAAGQPRPRIRWFRLATPGAATGLLRHRGQLSESAGQSKLPASRLDESQIRSSLLQLDSMPDSFQRVEISPKDGNDEQQQQQQQRWRIESAGVSQHGLVSRLVLGKADLSHNGLYECEAELESGSLRPTANEGSADRLRRVFGLMVNGKYSSGAAGKLVDRSVGSARIAGRSIGHKVGRV